MKYVIGKTIWELEKHDEALFNVLITKILQILTNIYGKLKYFCHFSSTQ